MPSFGLSQQQRQQQTLTPQQHQGLDLLQTNTMELAPYIRREADCNPAISLEEPDGSSSLDALRDAADREGSGDWDDHFEREAEAGRFDPGATPLPQPEGPVFEPARLPEAAPYAGGDALPAPLPPGGGSGGADAPEAEGSPEAPGDGDFSAMGADDADYLFSDGGNNEYDPDAEERRQFMFDSQVAPESLQEHLSRQLEGENLTAQERAIAEQIIGEIDENGYFRGSLADIAQGLLLGSVEPVEKMLALVQSFDPPGIGGRNARECLRLQALAEPEYGSAADQFAPTTRELAARILASDEDFEALAFRRFSRLARTCKTDEIELEEALAFIRTLDPRPGARISTWRPQLVRPEIIVYRDPETGRWVSALDESNLPRISLSRSFRAQAARLDAAVRARGLARRKSGDGRTPTGLEADRDFHRKCLSDAESLINGVRLRQNTLRQVAALVVEHQQAFFDSGDYADVRPLVMSEIAQRVGVHETTVSRAVSGKFARWPLGLVELRRLFTAKVSTAGSEDLSSGNIKGIIRSLIDHEDPANPLSDQELVRLLGERGIACARRTVAKYRDQMRILPSYQRKV